MKLLSGGQSGVDRAVLDVAIERGIDYGGWCPKDGWAEDSPKPPGLLAKYPKLKETPLPDPAQRTEWNVRDADACMIVIAAGGLAVSKGTALAEELAHRQGRRRRSCARHRRAARERSAGHLCERDGVHPRLVGYGGAQLARPNAHRPLALKRLAAHEERR
jgi:hypothetical protein